VGCEMIGVLVSTPLLSAGHVRLFYLRKICKKSGLNLHANKQLEDILGVPGAPLRQAAGSSELTTFSFLSRRIPGEDMYHSRFKVYPKATCLGTKANRLIGKLDTEKSRSVC